MASIGACLVVIGVSVALIRSASPLVAFLGIVILIVFSAGLLFILYGTFVEPKRIILNNKSIHIPQAPPCSIAVVSDMHVGPYKGKAYIRRVVQRINAVQPDCVLLVGDFLFDERSDVSSLVPLGKLRAPLGVFAVLGNHDAGFYLIHKVPRSYVDRSNDVTQMLQSLSINVLRNSTTNITLGTKTICIAGIDDIWMESSDLQQPLTHIPPDMPAILLSHNPDIITDARIQRFCLIVSGHTHGGQIRLPFIGPLAPLPCKFPRRQSQGISRVAPNTQLAITRGCGETHVRSRLFCPPEILLLHVNPPPAPST